MSIQEERLIRLGDDRLVDIVRNHVQCGLDRRVRERALALLRERGHDMEHLAEIGAFTNHAYERALGLYHTFRHRTAVALATHGVVLASLVVDQLALPEGIRIAASFGVVAGLLVQVGFLIAAFITQSEFYRVIGKPDEIESVWAYALVGWSFYFVLFFLSRHRMRDALRNVGS